MMTRIRTFAQRLRRDTSAVSVIEFAFITPLFLAAGMSGLEFVNFVLATQKVERIAASSADLFARNKVKPNEQQVNDIFEAIDLIAEPFDVKNHGRVIVTGVIGIANSSTNAVENKIVWQRCAGSLVTVGSNIGEEWTTNTDYSQGPTVDLPEDIQMGLVQMAVVAEVVYDYQPMISLNYLPGGQTRRRIRETSIYRVRAASFTDITPISGVTASRCQE
jgi:Flp pilus assembly protein TadG